MLLRRKHLKLLLTAVALLSPAAAADPSQLTREQQEQFLLRAKVIRSETLSVGITNSQRVTLDDGRLTHDAQFQSVDIFKPRYETGSGTEINFRDSYKFNIAAYRLDKLLGLNMVPVSVERKVAGKTGAVTWWVDDVLMDEMTRTQRKIVPPDKDRWNRQMWIVRVFDQLIANTDRNLGNLVITKDWTLWMIDHTRAFRTATDLPNPKNLEKCDRVLLERLRALDPAIVQRELQPYLTKMEMAGLLARRAKLVAFFDEKCAREGQGAALFEYLSQRDAHVAGGARVMPAAAPK
jgi:hypothetical protein